jgi:hypothetical protein
VSSLLLQAVAAQLNLGNSLIKAAMALFLTAYVSANHKNKVEGWNLLKNSATEILVDRPTPMSQCTTKINLSKVGNYLNKAN